MNMCVPQDRAGWAGGRLAADQAPIDLADHGPSGATAAADGDRSRELA